MDIKKVRVQLMKNGSKHTHIAFIFLFSVVGFVCQVTHMKRRYHMTLLAVKGVLPPHHLKMTFVLH